MTSFVDSWFFPMLAGGEEQGLNEPGVEAFKKSTSLGRETIQNIGDARSPEAIANGLPAIAEFELLRIPVNQVPGHEQLTRIFEACRDYLPKRFPKQRDQESNGLHTFQRALALLAGAELPVLRIRDRNTTGLRGTDGPSDSNTPYWRLIRGQGYSSREGVGGGTYGIGQRAPFAFSELRSVAYYTRLGDATETFVAKSVLCSFPHPDHGDLTQSKGWFCRRESARDNDWRSIRDADSIPPVFRRPKTDVGTDLYVLGYRNTGSKWKQELRRAVLRHFFGAIHGGLLEVHIIEGDEHQQITRTTISQIVQTEAEL